MLFGHRCWCGRGLTCSDNTKNCPCGSPSIVDRRTFRTFPTDDQLQAPTTHVSCLQTPRGTTTPSTRLLALSLLESDDDYEAATPAGRSPLSRPWSAQSLTTLPLHCANHCIHAGIAIGVGRAFRRVCLFVCLLV